MFVDAEMSRQLLICNMFFEVCSEGQLKIRCSNVSQYKLQKKFVHSLKKKKNSDL